MVEEVSLRSRTTTVAPEKNRSEFNTRIDHDQFADPIPAGFEDGQDVCAPILVAILNDCLDVVVCSCATTSSVIISNYPLAQSSAVNFRDP